MSQNTPDPDAGATPCSEIAAKEAGKKAKSEARWLRSHNIVKQGKRTSIRLDSSSILALQEISVREGIKVNEIYTRVEECRSGSNLTFSAAIRVFLLSYFRAAATEQGHSLAGHGQPPLRVTLYDPPPADTAEPTKKKGRPLMSAAPLRQPETAAPDFPAR